VGERSPPQVGRRLRNSKPACWAQAIPKSLRPPPMGPLGCAAGLRTCFFYRFFPRNGHLLAGGLLAAWFVSHAGGPIPRSPSRPNSDGLSAFGPAKTLPTARGRLLPVAGKNRPNPVRRQPAEARRLESPCLFHVPSQRFPTRFDSVAGLVRLGLPQSRVRLGRVRGLTTTTSGSKACFETGHFVGAKPARPIRLLWGGRPAPNTFAYIGEKNAAKGAGGRVRIIRGLSGPFPRPLNKKKRRRMSPFFSYGPVGLLAS